MLASLLKFFVREVEGHELLQIEPHRHNLRDLTDPAEFARRVVARALLNFLD